MKKWGAAILFMGLIFAIISFREGVAGMHAPVDIYGKDAESDYKEVGTFDMATADIYAILGCFASETVTENGVKTSGSDFYVIPVFSKGETYYIGLKLNEKTEPVKIDEIIKATDDYYNGYTSVVDGGTIKVTGCIKKMNKKLKGYWYEFFEGGFDSEEEMKKYAPAVYIDALENPETGVTFLYIAGAMILAGGVLLAIGLRGSSFLEKRATAQTYVVINGVTYPKSTFSHVNNSILNQEKPFAVQELHDITGLDLDECGKIIENWRKYYY